jgi:hypothetical protein
MFLGKYLDRLIACKSIKEFKMGIFFAMGSLLKLLGLKRQ